MRECTQRASPRRRLGHSVCCRRAGGCAHGVGFLYVCTRVKHVRKKREFRYQAELATTRGDRSVQKPFISDSRHVYYISCVFSLWLSVYAHVASAASSAITLKPMLTTFVMERCARRHLIGWLVHHRVNMLPIYGSDGFWRRIDVAFCDVIVNWLKGWMNIVGKCLLLRGNSLIKLFVGTLVKQ